MPSSSRSPAKSIAPPATVLRRWRLRDGVVRGSRGRPRPPAHLPACLPAAGRLPRSPLPSRRLRQAGPRGGRVFLFRPGHQASLSPRQVGTPAARLVLCPRRVHPAFTSRGRVARRKCPPPDPVWEGRHLTPSLTEPLSRAPGASSEKRGQLLGERATRSANELGRPLGIGVDANMNKRRREHSKLLLVFVCFFF